MNSYLLTCRSFRCDKTYFSPDVFTVIDDVNHHCANSTGSTNFATRVGTNIVPVAPVTRDTLSGVLNGENITDTTGYAGSLLNVVSPMTLRFNAAGSSVISIPDGGLLKVISGGILQTASSATAVTAVTSARESATKTTTT